MRHRSLAVSASGLLAAAAFAGSAQATFFAFATDHYTFSGSAGAAGTFTIHQDAALANTTLLVDDNGGVFPVIPITTHFTANLTAAWSNSTNVVGSIWQHTYTVSGTFSFLDPNTLAPILSVNIGAGAPGLFNVPGGQNSWSSTGAVLGADSFADVTYTYYAPLVAALGGASNALNYGVSVPNGVSAPSAGPDDFGFDLSALNFDTLGINVLLSPQTHLPLTDWKADSSFSGSTTGGVPTPGAAGLLGLAGLVTLRRRRA